LKLRERYRRLSFWNKLGAIGACAGIIGILLAFLLWAISPDPVSPSDLQQTARALQDQSATQYEAESSQLARLQETLDALLANSSLVSQLEVRYPLGFGVVTTDGRHRTFTDAHASDLRFDWSEFRIRSANSRYFTFDPPKIQFVDRPGININIKDFSIPNRVGSTLNLMQMGDIAIRGEILESPDGVVAFVFGGYRVE